MNLLEAIADRRAQVAVLNEEIEKLEQAAQLVAGIIDAGPMKPPPPVRKEPAVRAEAPAKKSVAAPKKRTRPGDSHFAQCGHPNTKENQTGSGSCRTCKNASQLAYLAKKAGKAPATKAEPDPVGGGAAVANLEAARHPAATVNQVAIANASKWQRQCVLLHFETGQRCSLMQGHEGLHSASGRTFKTGLNPAELGGTSRARELDALAESGR